MCREGYKNEEWTGLTFPFLHASNEEKPHYSSPITTKASSITFSAETGLSETLLGPG